MSNTSKIVTWVIVAIVVIGGIWYFMSAPATSAPTSTGTQTSQTAGTQSGTTGTVTTVTTTTTVSPTSPSDTSDAAINQDASNIDGQMGTLNADNSTGDAAANNASQEK